MGDKIKIIFLLTLFLVNNPAFGLPKCENNYENHCFGTINHKNGEKYVGEIKNYKYNGKGIYLYINGNTYEGEFKDGIQEGNGVFNFSNGGNENTITEFVYIPNDVMDADYFLNLQFMPLENDASPSRPVLFKIDYK